MRFGRLVSHRTLKLCPQVAGPGSTLSRLFVRKLALLCVLVVVSILAPWLFARLRGNPAVRPLRLLARGVQSDVRVAIRVGVSFRPADDPQLAATSPSTEEEIVAIGLES